MSAAPAGIGAPSLTILAGVAAITTTACGQPAGVERTLPSGHAVRILAMGPIVFAKSPPALRLEFQTSTPLTDLEAVRRQSDELWHRLALDCEKGGYQAGGITASGPPQGLGFVSRKASYNFVYQKEGGVWRTLEQPLHEGGRLDEALVRRVQARIDDYIVHDEPNAVLLYMAADWTVTIRRTAAPDAKPVVAARMPFVTETHASVSRASSVQHRGRWSG